MSMDDILEIIRKRSPPGILLFDMADRLIFVTKEALDVLAEIHKIIIKEKKDFLYLQRFTFFTTI
jgi:hypothetical protein